MTPEWAPTLAKAVTTALVVVTASALAEAFGPFWGALIACLPVSAGPAYVFIAIQQGDAFVAVSALSSFGANAATGAYLVVYALLAPKMSRFLSLGLALGAWGVVCLFIHVMTLDAVGATILNMVIYGAGYLILRQVSARLIAPVALKAAHWSDLPVRAIAVALFVTGVVLGSSALGPAATGLAAVFPVTFTSLLVILQPRIGPHGTSLLAANALQAMPGFGLMLLVIHLAIVPWGAVLSMLVGLAVSFAWSGGLMLAKGRGRRI